MSCPCHTWRSEGWDWVENECPHPLSLLVLNLLSMSLQKQLAEEQVASDLIVDLLKKETAALEDEQVRKQ